ncbi:bidirectional hydrogenase complex protein HoxE [Chloroflexus sp.]|uniref:bidirectional hydrogenase complex protein HoxE n=1 Tax=Chloroflexus sp. TaxID=1904827 RepID=UPI00298F2591|nr:bidirectional hydrogenase complex protein HoxE [Chloroflexus sp.]MCS6888722.1 bidirectional hydrogenase complex protein HoxE [Chloroflexus sp.]MCX7860208.1 bidirectional hydrogenase complex protein HoxE [Chloroflexus sp.]MDW8403969.1 bidirectional hydrogenase complex protein HoxE [Chloroflexus sp.]
MTTSTTETAADRSARPAGDNRRKILEATMKRFQYQGDALIEVLHKAQELYGFLSPELLSDIAQRLHLPPSRVYGVATFYHFFSLAPQGEHTCTICLGTACYVRGAALLLRELEELSGVKAGRTSADGRFSLLTARCLGACGLAPAAVLDGEVVGHADRSNLAARIRSLLGREE